LETPQVLLKKDSRGITPGGKDGDEWIEGSFRLSRLLEGKKGCGKKEKLEIKAQVNQKQT